MQRWWKRQRCCSHMRRRAGCGGRPPLGGAPPPGPGPPPREAPPRPAPEPPSPACPVAPFEDPVPPFEDPVPPCLLVETATVGAAGAAGAVTTMAGPVLGWVGVAVTEPYCGVAAGGAAFTWMIASTAQPGNDS